MINILNALKSLALTALRSAIIAVIGLILVLSSAECAWEKKSMPSSAEAPIDLAICQSEPDCFYVTTPSRVFQNKSGVWRQIFSRETAADPAVRIFTFSTSRDLWIQTAKSILRTHGLEEAAVRIYAANDSEKFPRSFFADEKKLWLGTSSGLWFSEDSGKTWQKKSSLADHLPVSLVTDTSIGLFFAAGDEWRLVEDKNVQTVLKLFDFQNTEDEGVSPFLEDEAVSSFHGAFFDFIETEESFYLATIKGIYQSRNGFDWQLLSCSGLKTTAVQRIVWDKKDKLLWAVTQDGLFSFDAPAKRWISQNDGFARRDLSSFLILDGEKIASSPEGLWIWNDSVQSAAVAKDQALLFNRLIKLEPSAREIHRRVIEYSDTDNAKIKRWHIASRFAALAPSFSLGKDFSNSNNIDIDRGSTSDPDRFIEGPREKDRGVDLDLSWDLGDFIFSSSQTSIDSREKLMVDLRNDLLSEATRLYYERRRLQAEVIHSPTENENAHLDRLLRLDELTSLLDVLTDGYLSRRLEIIYKNNIELEELWRYNQPKT